ncbi:hypothetical protein KDAU_01830 [Dictyobacter aurantiacus]|uniref:Uncharacterized protein n=2 Tax=Dictyobacter aurantiacus TaxID=1936993 RepID=A0A401Z7N0_9CHLR|nr:hypothetical protein KDAU_01830 [Dictyobacter aurantiacus]
MTNYTQSIHEPSLVLPRLRLQSRAIAAIQPEGDTIVDASSYTGVSSGEVEEGKLNTATQNTNILMRFAQRLTSSFSALNGPFPAEEASTLVSTASNFSQPVAVGMKASALCAIADVEVCTASTVTGSMPSAPKKSPIVAKDGHARQRLAGRTTRIRLEVVPNPASQKNKPARTAHGQSSDKVIEEIEQKDFVEQKSFFDLEDSTTTGMHLPVHHLRREDASSTSVHLPTVNAKKGESSNGNRLSEAEKEMPRFETTGALKRATQGSLSGTAFFAPGQREATVANPHITAASVVLITLTSNPGPVVVQYVSLQPQMGFTVHLTAPTAMHTSFNYIVLLGELF